METRELPACDFSSLPVKPALPRQRRRGAAAGGPPAVKKVTAARTPPRRPPGGHGTVGLWTSAILIS